MTESIADEDVAHHAGVERAHRRPNRQGNQAGERSPRSDAPDRRRRRPSPEHPWWGPMPADRHE